jgi:hypothetical protein
MARKHALRWTTAVVTAVFGLALMTGIAQADPVPDGGSGGSGSPGIPRVLTTPSFPLGFDLSVLGVPASQLATAGLAGATASTAGDGPNMFIVDDDLAQCPNAQFTTIQAAVDVAGGGQVKVCPGTYDEQVQIVGHVHDGLRLFSEQPLQAVIKYPLVETKQPRSVVWVKDADDVDIQHFTISGPFTVPGCNNERHTGVRIGDDASATIYGNHITEIRNSVPALRGCQDGIAVQVGRRSEFQAGSAIIRNNLIDLYQKGGVLVDGPGSYALVTQNQILGDLALTSLIAQNGVQVGRESSADVDHNIVRDNFYFNVANPNDSASGILLFETDAHVSVDHNDLSNNGIGIAIFEDSIGLLISHNNVTGSHDNGIEAFVGSAANTISYNKATNNAPVDCADDTTGTATAGTANFWIKDMGLLQNRPGLCRQPGA